jgi:hypothetical protein
MKNKQKDENMRNNGPAQCNDGCAARGPAPHWAGYRICLLTLARLAERGVTELWKRSWGGEAVARSRGGRLKSFPWMVVRSIGRCLRPMQTSGSDPVLRSKWILRLTNASVQGDPSSPGMPFLCVPCGLQRWWLAWTRRGGTGSGEDQERPENFIYFEVICDVWRSQLYYLYPPCIFCICTHVVKVVCTIFLLV